MALRSDAANKDEEDEQDLNAECNAFSGHLKHLLSLEHSGSIFLAVDENSPREERGPIIERASLQERKYEEHEENEERHGDTSFLG